MKLSAGIGVALLATAVVLGMAACHHSTSGAQGDDGGDDGGDDSFGAGDDTDLDAPAPSTCPALQQWQQTCSSASDPCAMYVVSHCMAYDQYLSDGARQAIDDCYGYEQTCCTAPAGDDASGCGYDVGTCVEQELIAVNPTAAQQKLATDYCALCSPGDSSCAGDFYLSDEAQAPGAAFLLMSDALVGQIDAKCATTGSGSSDAGGTSGGADGGGLSDAGAPGACASTFDSCAAAIYQPMLPSLTCPGSDAGP